MNAPSSLDDARERFIAWLRPRVNRWLSISDHDIARLSGLRDSDQGMKLLALLEAERLVEIELADYRRSFRFIGAAPPQPVFTREMLAAVAAAVPPQPLEPLRTRARPAPIVLPPERDRGVRIAAPVERLPAPEPAHASVVPPAPPPPPSAAIPEEKPAMIQSQASPPPLADQLLTMLEEAADRGDKCPSIATIKAHFKIGDAYARQLFSDLRSRGQITIDAGPSLRVVTIVATGKSTKGTPAARPVTSPVTAASAPPVGREARVAPIYPAPPSDEALPVAARAMPGFSADVAFQENELRLTVWLSADPGPMREFRPFLTIPLDEAHATELLGTAAIALRDMRQARAA